MRPAHAGLRGGGARHGRLNHNLPRVVVPVWAGSGPNRRVSAPFSFSCYVSCIFLSD
jgi:hypothetical protein